MKIFMTIFLTITILASTSYGKLYIWVDKDGIKHMSNISPKGDVVLKENKEEGYPPTIKSKEDLTISSWFPLGSESGFILTGEVKNNSINLIKKVKVRAIVKDNEGKTIFQKEVSTDPIDIKPEGIGNFKIENVKVDITFLSKKNLRLDIFNGGKVETKVPEKNESKPEPAKIEFTD
jgi:hypothetical protein